MATDPFEEERKRQLAALGQTAGSMAPNVAAQAVPSSGGAMAPNAAPQGPRGTPGTGYVNLQRYLDLNQGAGEKMAGDLAGGITKDAETYRMSVGQASGAQREGLRGQGIDIASRARLAGGPGRETLLAGQYGGQGGYSSGARGLDSFLAGAAGGNQLQQVAGKYGQLGQVLGVDAYSKGAAGGTPGKYYMDHAKDYQPADNKLVGFDASKQPHAASPIGPPVTIQRDAKGELGTYGQPRSEREADDELEKWNKINNPWGK